MIIAFPTLTTEPVVLTRDYTVRSTRSENLGNDDNLTGMLRIGGPVAVPIDSSHVASDPDLATFIAREEGQWVYQLVHLAVGFEHSRQLPHLESATVQFQLSSEDSAPPTAWSMAPLRAMDTEEVTTSVRLSPQLKLLGAEASVGTAERSFTRDRGRVFLEALGELQSNPKWEFRRTRERELRGSYRLALVLRSVAGAASSIAVVVSADVTGGSILRRYHAAIRPLTVVTRL